MEMSPVATTSETQLKVVQVDIGTGGFGSCFADSTKTAALALGSGYLGIGHEKWRGATTAVRIGGRSRKKAQAGLK